METAGNTVSEIVPSYELLGPAEQRLLARMSVFSGGCTLEAVEDVCSGDPVEPDAAMDLVAALVARSLVVADDHHVGTLYRLLETIRQYAEERLGEWGETETIRTRHAHFYRGLMERAAEHSLGPEQVEWGSRITAERDNVRSALANAIDAGDVAVAVSLVAQHDQDRNASAIGELFSLPVSRVLELPGAAEQPGYSRALILGAWHSFYNGDDAAAQQLCQQALDAEGRMATPPHSPRIESDLCALEAEAALSAGDYACAVPNYARAAQIALEDGYPGLAAIYLSYGVNTALLGGVDIATAGAMAEDSVALARRSGMPGAIVCSLNALALMVVEHDSAQARTLLREVIERCSMPGAEIAGGYLTGCVVAGRLREWDLTLALTAKTMYLYRWSFYPLQAATCLAECARAFAEDQPEVAGVLQGGAYAAFRRASPAAQPPRQTGGAPADPTSNFVLMALRETGELVAAAYGSERLRELRGVGTAMSADEAISYALAKVDPKLLTGRITVGEQSSADTQQGQRERPRPAGG